MFLKRIDLFGIIFGISITITFIILACALPGYNWWPMACIIPYLFFPFPLMICGNEFDAYNFGRNRNFNFSWMAWFYTLCIVFLFGIPAIMKHVGTLVGLQLAYTYASQV